MHIVAFFKNNGKYLFELSIFKTLWFNLNYFGLKGMTCPIWINRSVGIKRARGKIELGKYQSGIVKIGWQMMENFPRKTVWNMQEGRVTFNGYASLGRGTQIINKGELIFGDGFAITGNTDIICYKKICFGNEALISWECLIMDHDYHKLTDERGKVNLDAPIFIGNHVWIGTRNVILHGACIRDNCVVAANGTVTRKFDQESLLIAGNQVLKENINWNI